MMKRNLILTVLAVFCVMAEAIPAWAQLAQVTGKVTDNDKPQPGVQVVYKSQTTGRVIKMKTNSKAEFFQVGVPIDSYTVTVLDTNGKEVFKQDGVRVGIGGDNVVNTLNIDLTKGATASAPGTSGGPGGPGPRTEQFRGDKSTGSPENPKDKGSNQPKLTKEQIEAMKAQNARAEGQNALIKQAMDAMNAKNWEGAIPPLEQLTQNDPNRWQFFQALGNAQLNTGQFEPAIASYEKGIQVSQSVLAGNIKDPKNPDADPVKAKAGMAQMLTNEGNCYLKLHKNPEAIAAFEKAASMDPNPGIAYFNICATQYNTGNMEGAEAACDKAIAADPNKAEAYFIKGSAMFGRGKMDANNKWTVPPGTTDTLNKYLQLAPDGSHASDVKAMLESVGAKIETTYKAKKK